MSDQGAHGSHLGGTWKECKGYLEGIQRVHERHLEVSEGYLEGIWVTKYWLAHTNSTSPHTRALHVLVSPSDATSGSHLVITSIKSLLSSRSFLSWSVGCSSLSDLSSIFLCKAELSTNLVVCWCCVMLSMFRSILNTIFCTMHVVCCVVRAEGWQNTWHYIIIEE